MCDNGIHIDNPIGPPTDSVIKKYIEVREEQRFSVNMFVDQGCSTHKHATDLCWDLYFDGQLIDGYLVPKTYVEEHAWHKSATSAARTTGGQSYVNHFKFESLEICTYVI
jgi:hypothetical protein